MIPRDSRKVAVHLLECPALSKETTVVVAVSPGEAEAKCQPCSSVDWPEPAIPGWENLWVDFGGEG